MDAYRRALELRRSSVDVRDFGPAPEDARKLVVLAAWSETFRKIATVVSVSGNFSGNYREFSRRALRISWMRIVARSNSNVENINTRLWTSSKGVQQLREHLENNPL